MAIYTRNKEGNLVPLKIPAIKGEDGITPNIQIGTVTTLEPNQQATVENVGTLENPIFDFGIPKGQDGTGGGSGVKINDNTISKDEVWSSAKTEDFVLTNTDTVWTEVSGENLSIDYTKEGYLREVEIWGNTIQNEEDLSDIQHLGELYLDDEGEPILDSQGREQYKIEIESCNKNLFNKNIGILKNTIIQSSGAFSGFEGDFTQDVFIPIKPNTNYTFSTPIVTNKRVAWYDKDKVFISRYSNGTNKIIIKSPINAKYLKYSGGLSSIDDLQIEEGTTNTSFTPYQSHKTTILLPCQLMKVGDVYDRLYWDSEKNKYVVEKNIKEDKNIVETLKDNYKTRSGDYNLIINNAWDKLDSGNYMNNRPIILVRDNNSPFTKATSKTSHALYVNYGSSSAMTDKGYEDTTASVKQAFDETVKGLIFQTATPQLIETNITEQILLPSYIDKTHIFVTGGIDGSIKTKAPLDGGQAILSISQENKELKSVNQQQDELINISLCATDEMLTLLEPLLTNAVNLNSDGENHIVNMYVAMVNRKLKDIEEVPSIYKEKVKEILGI